MGDQSLQTSLVVYSKSFLKLSYARWRFRVVPQVPSRYGISEEKKHISRLDHSASNGYVLDCFLLYANIRRNKNRPIPKFVWIAQRKCRDDTCSSLLNQARISQSNGLPLYAINALQECQSHKCCVGSIAGLLLGVPREQLLGPAML